MVQGGVNLAFVIEGAGADVVVESNALPPPTGPLQQHGCERARLCPAQAVGIGGEAQDNVPSPFPPPPPPPQY